MATKSTVVVRAGRVCGAVRAEELAAADFTIGGAPATAEQTAALRGQVSAAVKGIVGREICTAYVPDGKVLAAKVSIDGVSQPNMDQRVIWVSPNEGYSVAP
jgi:hypothetical protein